MTTLYKYIIHIYIYIYNIHISEMGAIYTYICNHENNVSSWLSQWLCDNSCTWAHDVQFVVITGMAHCFPDFIYKYIYNNYIYININQPILT